MSISIWGQCGGADYLGISVCATGLSCIKMNDNYSRCEPTKPSTDSTSKIPKSVYGGGFQVGKTTRYWDCCKPSYSWPGKSSYVNSPVGLCARDGVALIDANSASACNGGNGFMCNSNQPFAVNDQLAYGFAAAEIVGLNDNEKACACFKLDFTSSTVAGKSMIVQVTNTGGDLGENQFDIQIPGGGVGIFNACSTQWGAPSSGWGERYGGITSKEQCALLPKELQPGCNFRFGWFANANNPAMTFSRVTCPIEITRLTGCKRSDE